MITDDQIRCAWDATKQAHQPIYDDLPHISRSLLRRRADNVWDFGLSGDVVYDAFERALLSWPEEDGQPEPLPVEVVEELVAEEPPFEPPPKGEDYASDLEVELFPVEPEPEVEEPPKKKRAPRTAKKLAETKAATKEPEKKIVLVKKAEKKPAPKATKKAVKK